VKLCDKVAAVNL